MDVAGKQAIKMEECQEKELPEKVFNSIKYGGRGVGVGEGVGKAYKVSMALDEAFWKH